MARISGVDLPNKRAEIALTYIYGIGKTTAKKILAEASLDVNTRMNDFDEDALNKIRDAIDKLATVEGELRSRKGIELKRLMDIGSYRGIRHRRGLPVRGQRTKTNARTRKGRRGSVARKK